MRDDIELTRIESNDVAPEAPPFSRENGAKNDEYGPSHNEESDSDEEDLIMDEGSRALLRSPRVDNFSGGRLKEPMVSAKMWPQIQGIVVEVNRLNCSLLDGS
jgi:hypothetical protein